MLWLAEVAEVTVTLTALLGFGFGGIAFGVRPYVSRETGAVEVGRASRIAS